MKALARLPENVLPELAEAAAAAAALCQPASDTVLTQRLAALGMTMAPNRAPAEAAMWLHETRRLLKDLPEDLLGEAIDECQRRLKFLPTVAEVRALAEPEMDRRRRDHARLDAMHRYVESGQPVPKMLPPQRPLLDRRGETMSEEDCEELNRILENLGACSRYRPDGSRYQVKETTARRADRGPPTLPTRQDYLDWGVDPAVLDRLDAGKASAATG
jgi:hypothetical protein